MRNLALCLQTVLVLGLLSVLFDWPISPSGVWAAEVKLEPTANYNWFGGLAGDSNHGNVKLLFSGRTHETGSRSIRRGFLKFDLASNLPPGAEISDVVLILHLLPTSNQPPHNISLYKLEADWSEAASNANGRRASSSAESADSLSSLVEYNTQLWTARGGDIEPTASATLQVSNEKRTYRWNSERMLADVREWQKNPDGNFGWLLLGNEEVEDSIKIFAGSEYPTTYMRPQLVVTYELPESVAEANH